MATNNRLKQLNHMFVELLHESMNTDGYRSLAQSSHNYKVNGADRFALMIKSIIQMCGVDSFANAFNIRNKMSDLPVKLVELKFDIKEFNMYVNDLVEQFATT